MLYLVSVLAYMNLLLGFLIGRQQSQQHIRSPESKSMLANTDLNMKITQ